jgi:Universal stress protein family
METPKRLINCSTEKNVRYEILHILAPTDLTLDAQKAVDYAVALGRDFGARLTLLHVYNSNFGDDYVFGANNYSDEDRHRADAEKALRQLCVDYKENYTGIDNCYRVGVPSRKSQLPQRS